MESKKTIFKALIIAGLLSISQVSEANLISNGSFEMGSFVPDALDTMSLPTESTVMTGWRVINDTVAWIGGNNPFLVYASDGNFYLDLTDYSNGAPFGGVSQTIATEIGQSYEFSFDLGSSNLWGRPSAILVTAGSTSAIFTSALTGGDSDWERFILPFTATSTSTTISVLGNAGVNYIGLDNVSVSAAPVPAAFWLIGSGFAGLAVIRRKFTKQN